MVEGQTPFLLSRRVLQEIKAILDMENMTITSAKHGLKKMPLKRAANRHMLLSICPETSEFEPEPAEQLSAEVSPSIKNEPNTETAEPPAQTPLGTKLSQNQKSKKSQCETRRAFQHVVKNT